MPVTPGHDHAPQSFAPALLERRFELADEAATDAFGARFAKAIEAEYAARTAAGEPDHNAFSGLQVQLIGDLGAGKTSLVRATLRALGHAGRVRSPTYTLVEPYTVATAGGELPLYHFDLYRFSDPAEWADAGFREYFDSGAVCLVEWPQRAGALLGVPDLVFTLEPGERGDGRVLTAQAFSASGKACLERC
ncbi:tRNA (adenosine(37)-N6)-threonylcarbamoyltransferase complex ATPase subunit type 1 TsaE [Paraburkholderia caballeronis]|uniref:tRNA threonylcarbamoyladenosine biosynthesis protein TsaE n=1 Tax=Paraburkholderia caballeronis TaxID=416943 RepID=A0A1H7R087_9BURK|nr:tRNA (adenosine(37)-N6)-threonylcarbamoyltransferase complex ATPase subunit type 1 TsaE [Paraburkholderia caballeronis]PXW23737.1 tRNA threonylcarbamoyladenosine biosynthesis protein TsaE [Paraburkholderia caballeronis]PXW99078.1 tRNA threonylcarbamoyladenosine biosynthesis protein TsaE [Paraburkholderia caballeronis]RAJ96284.1 tRNA threonylcarbamoyladenosine biosynthesis protein TsaE [Paraburkholderia caballeronis]SEC86295.1 tRNA threonylcarbamoyladenosine biosynthesis protein TsaE [Parabur